MEKQKNIPKLRFPEFDEEWEDRELGKMTRWYSGGTPSKMEQRYWNGNIPWISASSMRGIEYSDSELKISNEGLRNGSRLAQKGWLLILVRGSMLFKKIPIGIVTEDVAFNQDVKAIEVISESDALYILYYLYSKEGKLLNIVTGTGIGAGKLDLDDLKSFITPIPSLSEQQKIASFFTSIDKKISQLEHKKTLLELFKKGVMQIIFSQEIRFRDDNGKEFPKWEKKRLGDVLIEHKTVNSGNKFDEVFSVAKHKGVINQIEHLGRSFSAKDISNYKVINPHDIVYTKSPTSDFPFGIIKQNLLCRSGVVSPLYGVFKPETDALGFLLHNFFLSWINTYNYLNPLVQKGAKNTMNINNNDFLNGARIPLPVSEFEQIKIANFLSSIDGKINHTQKQIEKIEVWKKGLMQQMFV